MSAQTIRRRRKTGRQTLHYLLLLIVAGGILAVLSYTVFFPIEKIQVEGLTRYAAEGVVKSSGIQQGDNLLRIRESAVEELLRQNHPYIEKVNLRRIIPGTLVLQITEAVPLGACYTPAGYVVLGENGRVLDLQAKEPPEGVSIVSGMYFYEPVLGQVLGTGYTEEEQEQAELEWESFTMLSYLAKAVQEVGFSHITMADLSDRLNMMLLYDDRVIVELGSEADLTYKLQFVKHLLENELDTDYHGVLDASLAADSKKVWSDPGDIQEELAARGMVLAPVAGADDPDTGETSPESTSAADDTGASSAASGDNPDLAVVPNSGTSSGAAESSSLENDAASASQSVSNPDLAVIPGSGISSDAASSENDISSSSSMAYSPEDLAVIPGTGFSSSEAENTASQTTGTASGSVSSAASVSSR